MIIVRHIKDGDLSYVSHRDIQSVLRRGINRAGIKVKYSQGFNPHMLTYCSAPLPLGVQSTAEYFGVECDGISADEFLTKFNNAIPKGIRAEIAWECPKNPNVAGNVVASDYCIADVGYNSDITNIMQNKQYNIDVVKKGQTISQDIRGLIFGINFDNNNLYLRLASGNVNLRIDNFVNHLNNTYNTNITLGDIVRIAQLQYDGKTFSNIERSFE